MQKWKQQSWFSIQIDARRPITIQYRDTDITVGLIWVGNILGYFKLKIS